MIKGLFEIKESRIDEKFGLVSSYKHVFLIRSAVTITTNVFLGINADKWFVHFEKKSEEGQGKWLMFSEKLEIDESKYDEGLGKFLKESLFEKFPALDPLESTYAIEVMLQEIRKGQKAYLHNIAQTLVNDEDYRSGYFLLENIKELVEIVRAKDRCEVEQ